ncbi:MAG: MATE family efflux transporter [Planctomycetia bacterium]|nr:MATE family efflux transporter [Planctomycetia bacterium]
MKAQNGIETHGKLRSVDFTHGAIGKSLIVFATPLFLSSALQIAYNVVDMIVVGRTLGYAGISAVAVGGDVVNFLTYLAIGFSNATQVIVAQYLGMGRRTELGRLVATAFSFLCLIALLLSIVCFGMRHTLLAIMHAPPEALTEATRYANVALLGLIFIYGYNVSAAILRGMGDSLRPFFFIVVATLTNIALDLILVVALKLGAFGAALATLLSQALSCACSCAYLAMNREKYRLTLSWRDFLKWDWHALGKLTTLGVPMALKNASVQSTKLFVNSWVNSYGVAASAFAGITNKLSAAANLVSNSFNTAGATMIGQNIGAGRYDRVRRVMTTIFKITGTLATVWILIFIFFPRQIYGCFTTSEEVLAIGVKFVPIAIVLFYGAVARSGMNALINGSGNYKVNFVTAILDGVVLRIGLALLFGLGFKMRHFGFWLGDALAGYTPFFVGLGLYLSGAWKRSCLVPAPEQGRARQGDRKKNSAENHV